MKVNKTLLMSVGSLVLTVGAKLLENKVKIAAEATKKEEWINEALKRFEEQQIK